MDSTTPISIEKLAEKRQTALIVALREALAHPEEHRLFKSGKLAGLFSTKTGPVGDAAALAIRAGYLESVREEVKGKIVIEWVRITPRGVEFLHEQDSPKLILKELQSLLNTTEAGVPIWLESISTQLNALNHQFNEQMKHYLNRLDALQQRVSEAIRRSELSGTVRLEAAGSSVPWGIETLRYLDHRQAVQNGSTLCPMPELFQAVQAKYGELTIPGFHEGLIRLEEKNAIQIHPTEALESLTFPEYALIRQSKIYYMVSRS